LFGSGFGTVLPSAHFYFEEVLLYFSMATKYFILVGPSGSLGAVDDAGLWQIAKFR
jgi:hypothetical protein